MLTHIKEEAVSENSIVWKDKHMYGNPSVHNLLSIITDTSRRFEDTETDFAPSYTLCS